ncbi:MAG: hypothetical protein ACOH2M_03365 [Cypionkella sp.]
MTKYTRTLPLHFALWDAGVEHELEAVFTYRVLPGNAASFLEPEELPSVEIDKLILRTPKTRVERAIPDWLHAALCDDESLMAHLMDEAAEDAAYAADEAADAHREQSREAFP